MKSFILAASAAAVVRASALDLNLGGVAGDLDLDNILNLGGLDIKLPGGLSLPGNEEKPYGPPADGRTNVWHPPHDGIIIDGCDDDHNDHWHYVHPCDDDNDQPPHVWTTSTITATHTHTVIECAPTVVDCPGGHKTVTLTIPATTTICPVPVTTPAGDYPTPTGAPPTPPAYTPPVYTMPAEPTGPVYTSPSEPTEPVYTPPSQPTGPVYPPPSEPTGGPVYPPPQSFTTYPAPPVYTPPSNQTTPVYYPPSPQPTGCVGAGCGAPAYPPPAGPTGCTGAGCPPYPQPTPCPAGEYCPPAPVAGTGQPSGTGAYPTPTLPPVIGSASKQSVGALIFAGLIAAFLL